MPINNTGALNTISATALLNLEIRDRIKPAFHVNNGLFLTNDIPTIERLLQPTHLLPVIGSLEMEILLSGRPVLIMQTELGSNSQVKQELLTFLYIVQRFIDSIWLQIDCAVNNELAFTTFFGNEKVQVDSNFLAVKYRDSNNSETSVSITMPMMRRIIRNYFARLEPVNPETFSLKIKFDKDANRFQIANHHLHAARCADTLEMKLSSYCSAFEAMLSTSTTELAHQLSERLAVLTAVNTDDRLRCYQIAKRAYAVRSKVVHGSYISAKDGNDITLLCKTADSWARQLLCLYLKDENFQALMDSRDNEKIDAFFLQLIFQ